MKEFYKNPYFNNCCDLWRVTDLGEITTRRSKDTSIDEEQYHKQNVLVPKVIISYGSETGTSESIAFNLARTLWTLKPIVLTLNKLHELLREGKFEYTHVLIVCSTFGAGMPPTNARDFLKNSFKSRMPVIDAFFSVLALGSRNYEADFCKVGKALHGIMVDMGASPLLDVTCADTSIGDQNTASNWCLQIKIFLFLK